LLHSALIGGMDEVASWNKPWAGYRLISMGAGLS